MRAVTLTIAKLGLSIGNTINIKLVNVVGKELSTQDFVLSTATFSTSFSENDTMAFQTYYKLTIPNGLSFNFSIPTLSSNEAHDLYSLLKISYYKGIIKIYDDDSIELDTRFITKLNLYFTGKNPHFTLVEQNIIYLYKYYADEVLDTISTIDIMMKIDEYLAKISTIGAI